jgi:Uma2 family endonuclease
MSNTPVSTKRADSLKLDKLSLPTMYDLPSENPEEPGLPDEFHDLQPQLLSATLRLTDVKRDRIFTGTDLNLYYDLEHTWYKRPDWFVVLNVPRLYEGRDLRMSYVRWDEGVSPSVIVELLSEGTDKEDLGLTQAEPGKAPTKWTVYEQILKVPYYVVYDRHKDILRAYELVNGQYQALKVEDGRVALTGMQLSLGLWQGEYDGITRQWLRWIDSEGNWIPTPLEQAEREREQAEQQREQAEQQREQVEQQRNQAQDEAARLAAKLRELGIDPNQI